MKHEMWSHRDGGTGHHSVNEKASQCPEIFLRIVVVLIDRGRRVRGCSRNDTPPTFFTILGARHHFDAAIPSISVQIVMSSSQLRRAVRVLCTPVLSHGRWCGLRGIGRGGGWCGHTTSVLFVWKQFRHLATAFGC